jgi:hypothetical protein
MISRVYRFQNDMVMVFDEHGKQIPEFQGPFEEVKEKIEVSASPATVFSGWREPIPWRA